jgi:hypothetical protein
MLTRHNPASLMVLLNGHASTTWPQVILITTHSSIQPRLSTPPQHTSEDGLCLHLLRTTSCWYFHSGGGVSTETNSSSCISYQFDEPLSFDMYAMDIENSQVQSWLLNSCWFGVRHHEAARNTRRQHHHIVRSIIYNSRRDCCWVRSSLNRQFICVYHSCATRAWRRRKLEATHRWYAAVFP